MKFEAIEANFASTDCNMELYKVRTHVTFKVFGYRIGRKPLPKMNQSNKVLCR